MMIQMPNHHMNSYDKFLTIEYGDWHKFVKGGGKHEVQVFSADIPYKEMLQRIVD